MSKSIKVAVVQMDACPGPSQERLAKAKSFVRQCAERGAQLVVLPEVFNTGYEYSDQNYVRAESFDGPTAGWLRKTAARYHVHLAGSFLRKDQNEIYNTLLLVAPDGREWHYDKNYPWIWERAYFRKGTNITVADTELGKIGFLICWDVAHPALWKHYAGKVQLIVISSCPPRALDSTFIFGDGQQLSSGNAGALVRWLRNASAGTFGEYQRRQAGFLGVPVAHAAGTGTFRSSLPHPGFSLAMLSAMYPTLLKHSAQFSHAHVEAGYYDETYIADRSGAVLECVPPHTEGIAVSDITLPDAPPQPKGKQPPFGIPRFSYLFDTIANRLLAPEYRKKTKRYLCKQD